MTGNIAVPEGFTVEVYGEYAGNGLHLLTRPGEDLSQRFKAWDTDCQEFIYVNGWLTDFQPC